jgi:hypothetical protein
MKRESAVALSIAAAAFSLLITQFAPAQAAPSNETPCAASQAAPGNDFVYWMDLYGQKPCAATQQAAPSNDTSSVARQADPGNDFVYWMDSYLQKPWATMQQAAPSNDTSYAAMHKAAPSNDTSSVARQADPGDDFVYWMDSYLEKPSAAMQQAAPSNDTSGTVLAQASLDRTIDANKVKQGDPIKATLIDKVEFSNGPELPRGTELVGQVTVDRMQDDGTFRLALTFTNAQLKDGTVIPIKATILRLYAPSSSYPLPVDTSYYAYPLTNSWNGQLQADQPGALEGVDLHSSIEGSNSGNFVSNKKDEIKVLPETVLGLAITVQKGS